MFVAREVALPGTGISDLVWVGINPWFSKPLPCYLAMIGPSPVEAFFWCHRGLAGSWCKGIAHLHNWISGMGGKIHIGDCANGLE